MSIPETIVERDVTNFVKSYGKANPQFAKLFVSLSRKRASVLLEALTAIYLRGF